MSEPVWVADSDDMKLGLIVLITILSLPFIPPFKIGFYVGEHLSNLNGVRYLLGTLFALGWLGVLYWVREHLGARGLLVVFMAEALFVDVFFAYKNASMMWSVEKLLHIYHWFMMSI